VLRCPGVGKSERTGAACALRRPVAKHFPALLIAGRGVPWPGLWLTTPGAVPEAGEAALGPLS
jgi:hypothetical protein